jgi:hypothetical protein
LAVLAKRVELLAVVVVSAWSRSRAGLLKKRLCSVIVVPS